MRNFGSVYMHVGNSGATFEVVDVGHGPTIVISTSAFGNLQNELKVFTDAKSLEQLGTMLLEASKQQYSEVYCHPARSERKPSVETS